MRYVLIVLLMAGVLAGCAKKDSAEAPVQADKEKITAEKQSKEATMEVKAQMKEMVEVKQQAVSETLTKPEVQMPAPVQMAGGVEQKAEGGWGFSVYDPVAGEIGYYTSSGMLVGREKR